MQLVTYWLSGFNVRYSPSGNMGGIPNNTRWCQMSGACIQYVYHVKCKLDLKQSMFACFSVN